MSYCDLFLTTCKQNFKLIYKINLSLATFYQKIETYLFEPEIPFYFQASQELNFAQYQRWCNAFKKITHHMIYLVLIKKINPYPFWQYLLEHHNISSPPIISPIYYDYYLQKAEQKISQYYEICSINVFKAARIHLKKQLKNFAASSLGYFYYETINHFIQFLGQQISFHILEKRLPSFQELVTPSLYTNILNILRNFFNTHQHEFKGRFYVAQIPPKEFKKIIKQINLVFLKQFKDSNNYNINFPLFKKIVKPLIFPTLLSKNFVSQNETNWVNQFTDKSFYILSKAKNMRHFFLYSSKHTLTLGFISQILLANALSAVSSNERNHAISSDRSIKENSINSEINFLNPECLVPPGCLNEGFGNEEENIFRISPNALGIQSEPCVVAANNRKFTVTWTDAPARHSLAPVPCAVTIIKARQFNSTGHSLNEEFIVSKFNDKSCGEKGEIAQKTPSIAEFDNGDYVIVWQNQISLNIEGQYFYANSERKQGTFFVNVNSTFAANPKVINLESNKFIVFWEGIAPDDLDWGIYGRVFNSDRHPLTDEFLVNVKRVVAGPQLHPAVTKLNDENIIIVWESFNKNKTAANICALYWNSNEGSSLENTFWITDDDNNINVNPSVAASRNFSTFDKPDPEEMIIASVKNSSFFKPSAALN